MCGICGIVGFDDKNLLNKMCEAMVHRGPDDSGIYVDSGIGLGHRRLSIIDLKTGHQPVHNEDESVWIVFNGEIYNFKELRKELENKGHRFYTSTDTEVIVHSYEEYGDCCAEKFNGDFAFAIWDGSRKKLFLARDPIGVKPLYYTVLDGCLLFSSEIKSLLQYREFDKKLNYNALHRYLTFQYSPGPETMIEGIFKLQPGHTLTYTNGSPKISQYWDLNPSETINSESYICNTLLKLLKDSISRRLMSDVPLGAYLSGGLDSSVTVGLMSEMVDEPVKTFSVGFGAGEPIDELKYAKIVADHFGTEHHEIIIQPDAFKQFPRIIWHLDEPISDPAVIPTYFLSGYTKKYVTVVLTGEGGDEVFAGYEKYKLNMKIERLARFYRKVPSFISIPVVNACIMLSSEGSMLKRHLQFILESGEKDYNYIKSTQVFSETDKENLYSDSLKEPKRDELVDVVRPHFQKMRTQGFLAQMQYSDIKTWLVDDLLMKVDKTTMAHGIEARVPLLDKDFVEFSFGIPPYLKLNGTTGKYIFRKLASTFLPREIVERRKHGFTVPINQWLDGELKDIVSQVLSESSIHKEYFKYDYINNMLNNKTSKQDYSHKLWALLTFEIWHRLYMGNDVIGLKSPKAL